jgi:hypothetical protein
MTTQNAAHDTQVRLSFGVGRVSPSEEEIFTPSGDADIRSRR